MFPRGAPEVLGFLEISEAFKGASKAVRRFHGVAGVLTNVSEDLRGVLGSLIKCHGVPKGLRWFHGVSGAFQAR